VHLTWSWKSPLIHHSHVTNESTNRCHMHSHPPILLKTSQPFHGCKLAIVLDVMALSMTPCGVESLWRGVWDTLGPWNLGIGRLSILHLPSRQGQVRGWYAMATPFHHWRKAKRQWKLTNFSWWSYPNSKHSILEAKARIRWFDKLPCLLPNDYETWCFQD
jgi:hypothetical protein